MTKKYKKPLTPKDIASLPDADIDTGDIPELDEKFWANARLSEPRTKAKVSMRLDKDVLEFFKAKYPKGFTARMAFVLTAYANAHQN